MHAPHQGCFDESCWWTFRFRGGSRQVPHLPIGVHLALTLCCIKAAIMSDSAFTIWGGISCKDNIHAAG